MLFSNFLVQLIYLVYNLIDNSLPNLQKSTLEIDTRFIILKIEKNHPSKHEIVSSSVFMFYVM